MTRLNLLRTGALALVAAGALAATGAQARDTISIVGSSTVFPYSQAAAEEYAAKTKAKAPVVESLGTGGGFKAFCGGIGPAHADITGASRAITASEKKLCADNGVTDITEVLLGYDGLSIAMSRKNSVNLDLTEEQIFRALAAELPNAEGKFVPNPNKNWSDIDPKLPKTKISVLGPPPTSGTRDAFVELVMHDGCNVIPAIKALRASDRKQWDLVCSRMRQDGAFIESGENDNLIVQSLDSDPNAIGIFGYSALYENQDKLKGAKINGIAPSIETIADGSYPVARPLFIYVKNAHRGVIPGLDDFLKEFVSDSALGDKGYLAERGITPLKAADRKKVQDAVVNRAKLAM